MSETTTTLQAADGTELHVRSWAHPEPHATLLLVHGGFEHIGRFEHVAAFFVERGYEVHGYDHRGHGRSGGPRVDLASFDQYAQDLERVVRAVQRTDRPLVVYAHSMGGLVATLYAASSRPQPDLYVLSAPSLDVIAPGWQRALAKRAPGVLGSLRMKAALDIDGLSRDPDVIQAYEDDPLVDLKATVRWGSLYLQAMDEANDVLAKIAVPMLVIHGTDDGVAPPSASAPLAAVPGVERKLFPGLRHEMHNEPEQGEVLAFVASWVEQRLAAAT